MLIGLQANLIGKTVKKPEDLSIRGLFEQAH